MAWIIVGSFSYSINYDSLKRMGQAAINSKDNYIINNNMAIYNNIVKANNIVRDSNN